MWFQVVIIIIFNTSQNCLCKSHHLRALLSVLLHSAQQWLWLFSTGQALSLPCKGLCTPLRNRTKGQLCPKCPWHCSPPSGQTKHLSNQAQVTPSDSDAVLALAACPWICLAGVSLYSQALSDTVTHFNSFWPEVAISRYIWIVSYIHNDAGGSQISLTLYFFKVLEQALWKHNKAVSPGLAPGWGCGAWNITWQTTSKSLLRREQHQGLFPSNHRVSFLTAEQ